MARGRKMRIPPSAPTARGSDVELELRDAPSRRAASFLPDRLGYDAASSVKRRRAPVRTSTYSEDDELNATNRKRLVATTRDLTRNFAPVGWMIRKHLDYVSTFKFQSRSRVPEFDARLEALFDWWTRPEKCDAAGRHSLYRMIRLVEQCRTVDGDAFLLKLNNGTLQAIEADRVLDPGTDVSGRWVHGVDVDAAGRALRYAVHRRGSLGRMELDQVVDARDVLACGYYDRIDQVRGISRLASAVNAYQDIYESVEYALAKAKVSQLFGLVTYRERADALGDIAANDVDSARYDVNFGSGPFHLDLDDGDKAEVLESRTPSTEFQAFMQTMIAAALKSLDIPYSFYDESHTNYSGARQAMLQYEQSVRAKRRELQDLLDSITVWKLRQWVASGLIDLPADVADVRDLAWEWVPMGLPWIDPLKEVQAEAAAVAAGLASRQQIMAARRLDFYETADQLAAEQAYLEARGVTTAATAPAPAAPAAQEPETERDDRQEETDAK
jgi:capsid protein